MFRKIKTFIKWIFTNELEKERKTQMRIISDFKDYYDSVQMHGQDLSLIYKRESIKEPCKYSVLPFYMKWECPFEIDGYIIGFCGKLYRALEIKTILHSVKDFDSFVEKNQKEIDKRFKKPYNFKRFSKYVNAFFEIKCNSDQEKRYLSHFEKAPIFVIKDNGKQSLIEYNPRLNKYDFARVKNPFDCFQELQQYLSNIAVSIKEIPKIDDETMIEIKGFDKFSFRKDKQK